LERAPRRLDVTRYSSKSWRAFRPGSAPAIPVATRARPDEPPARGLQVVSGRCRILGLDPGSLRTGFGIIDVDGPELRCVAQGRIVVAGAALAERMLRIHAGVRELLESHAPDECAVERVFVSRNVDSALKLGQARGAALAALGGGPVFEYAPRAIKSATVGYGAADKTQVAHMVRQLLKLAEPLTADAADALAVALCHAQSRRLGALGAVALSAGSVGASGASR
jgi:crossover junction endodeoxyribonuclease RuvC